MFSTDVCKVMTRFETEVFKLDISPMSRCSRINIAIPDFFQAMAISSLFTLCNTSNQFSFFAKRDDTNRNSGIMAIITDPTGAGKKVDAVFISSLKKSISKFSHSLLDSWVPYSINNCDNFFTTGISGKHECAYSKEAKEGTYALYLYVNKLSGNKLEISGLEENGGQDLIAGSKVDLKNFFNNLSVFAYDIQKHFD